MASWFRIVVCPNCSSMREVGISQKKWKCSHCKDVYEVKSTLWKKGVRGDGKVY